MIPLLTSFQERQAVTKDADHMRRLIATQGWSFEHTLRVFSSVVFYSGKSRRKRAIAWLEELLRDLKDTRATPLEADNSCWDGKKPS